MTRAQQLVTRLLENEPDDVNPRDYLRKVEFRKIARSYRIVDHGLMFSDYFSGHGTAYTDWEDCATGYADDAREAVGEALDMLAQNEWDLSEIEDQIKAEMASWNQQAVQKASVSQWIADNITPEQQEEGDFDTPNYIMSVDVSQEGEGYDPVTVQPT